jgi:hypothetical protein
VPPPKRKVSKAHFSGEAVDRKHNIRNRPSIPGEKASRRTCFIRLKVHTGPHFIQTLRWLPANVFKADNITKGQH